MDVDHLPLNVAAAAVYPAEPGHQAAFDLAEWGARELPPSSLPFHRSNRGRMIELIQTLQYARNRLAAYQYLLIEGGDPPDVEGLDREQMALRLLEVLYNNLEPNDPGLVEPSIAPWDSY